METLHRTRNTLCTVIVSEKTKEEFMKK